MDDQSQCRAEFRTESTEHGPPNNQFTGAFFSQAQDLVVAGGSFKSVNVTFAPPSQAEPSDFRRIPIGDLNLLHEICLDCKSGVVSRRQGEHSGRRLYYARILGLQSAMTVALYQGEHSEEEWGQHIARCSWFRHPNLVQLCAIAKSSDMHAVILHEELIPVDQMVEKYRRSDLSMMYIAWNLGRDFWDAKQYAHAVSGEIPYLCQCTMWIRPSTGRLCVELTPSENESPSLYTFGFEQSFWPTPSLLEPLEDSEIIASFPLDSYHKICVDHFSHYRELSVSANAAVHMGSIISCCVGFDIEQWTEIACIPGLKVTDLGWSAMGKSQIVAERGWTRIYSSDIKMGASSRHMCDAYSEISRSRLCWLTQANHIFDRLKITSDRRNYVLITHISYELTLSNTNIGNRITILPPGYLFLCPLTELKSDGPFRFRLPNRPAYWSLHPSGIEPLSTEEAVEFGFPSLELTMTVSGCSWDDSIYAGLRQFHQGKGYAPESQELARDLGFPLYQVSCEEYDSFRLNEFNPTNECPHEESEPNSSFTVETSWTSCDVQMSEPSKAGSIIMGVQFTLMVTALILSWLNDELYAVQFGDLIPHI